jgi:hypothetical protein
VGARRLGLGVVVVALWLVATGCGGSGGAAGNAGAVSGTQGTSGGGASTGPAATGAKVWGPVREVPAPTRFAALLGVSDRWKELSKLPDVAGRRKQMANYIAAQPEFEESGVARSSVWGRFTDQRLMIIVDVPSRGGGPTAQAPSPHASTLPEAPQATLAFGIPADRRGLMLSQLGSHGQVPEGRKALIFDWFPAVTRSATAKATDDQLQGMLKASGYTASEPDMTVQSLKATSSSDVAVLYINTHGGSARVRPNPNSPGSPTTTFGMMTTQLVPIPLGPPNMGQTLGWRQAADPSGLTPYLREASVVYMHHEEEGSPSDSRVWYYAVSALFFTNYVSLSQHALVWLNVCDSMGTGDYGPDGLPLPPDQQYSAIPLVKALTHAGADLVVGWDNPVTPDVGWGSALLGFDLLTGANHYPYNVGAPVAPVDGFPLKPAARPFQWSTVRTALQNKNLAASVDTSGGVATTATLVPSGPGLVLAPGITYIDVQQTNPDSIQIHGEFGDDPGSANRDVYLTQRRPTVPSNGDPPPDTSLYGEKVTPACTWNSDTITCHLQGGFATKAGWVRVVARGHPSNPVPITMWRPTITYLAGNGIKLTLSPLFRADIQSYRENAIDKPKFRPVPADGRPNFIPSTESRCSYQGMMKVGDQVDATVNNLSDDKNIVVAPRPFPASRDARQQMLVPFGGLSRVGDHAACAAGGVFDPTTSKLQFDFTMVFPPPDSAHVIDFISLGGYLDPASGCSDPTAPKCRYDATGPLLIKLSPPLHAPDYVDGTGVLPQNTVDFDVTSWMLWFPPTHPGSTIDTNAMGWKGDYPPDNTSAR